MGGPASDLTTLSLTELAGAIRRRDVSPVEVIESFLARIEAVNPSLNAIVHERPEAAREEAVRAEKALVHGRPGRLHGVPFTVKDVIATAGVPTTCGSRALADYVPPTDATAVARLKAAGAILVGKTNCSEFALQPVTECPLFGETRSPLGDVTPGGSSGGESAAIAAGCSPLGIGTDFGGSLRWPAHCTGIAALRPTVGRVPGTGQLPMLEFGEPAAPSGVTLQGRLQVIGPLARNAADLGLVLDVLAGPDGVDAAALPEPVSPVRGVDPLALGVAWWGGEGSFPVRHDLVAAVECAAGRLAELGADVVRERPDGLDGAERLYSLLRTRDDLHDLRRAVVGQEAVLGQSVRDLLAAVRPATVAELRSLWAEREALRARFLGFLARRPVVLLPVAALPAFDRHGILEVDGAELSRWDVIAPCRAISLFGVPAAVVRFGSSRERLPIGIQIVGRPFHEHEVLAVAALLEAAYGDAEPTSSQPDPAVAADGAAGRGRGRGP